MLTCNINTQSTLPVNTKEQLVAYTKAQLLETLISYSSDNTLTFTGWYTPIQSTVHQTGMLLHPVYPKYTQHHKSTSLHLPKRCLYTSLYTATTEDIRPTIWKLLQGWRWQKIITWDLASFHYSIHVSSTRNGLKQTKPKVAAVNTTCQGC